MKKIIVGTILIAFTAGAIYSQQTLQSSKDGGQQTSKVSNESSAVPDDDGGLAFVVRRNNPPLESLTYHGGSVISQPQQVNIFLGNSWSKASNKSRESLFTNPIASLNAKEREFLTAHQIEFTETAPLSQEALDFKSQGNSMTDLQVQEVLSGMFDRRWLNPPDASTIYVVFLPPGLQSTLAERVGGKHYVAYHNFVHLDGVQVHYVVAPFETDVRAAEKCVLRAVVDTAVNPAGDGWY